ncbi:hypothetical protein [Naasia sp. SYSU D00948]|uniref:hypothetical protein n=1 Tax=Naasia sp. SYSU D00948 TaxID=2817379 RepID=UPI001B314CD7|nr:hypothetical protein [Naasia sp. SYSU D00948]
MAGRVFAAAVLGMLVLAGCTSNPVAPVEQPTGTVAPAPSATATSPAGEPSPTPTGPTTVPVTQTCDELLPAQALFDFNPNYALDPDYAPEPDSIPALMVSYEGAACGWINLSSGDTIEVAVAHLGTGDIEKVQNELVLTTPSVPTYGGVDYFEYADGVGTATVFKDDFWIVLSSVEFFEPGDAVTLVDAVKTALG